MKYVNVQATKEDASSDEDLDDDAMLELDKSLSALFSEQKKKVQAKKDEKTKLRKERALVLGFRIKVGVLTGLKEAADPRVLPVLTLSSSGCRCWT